MSCDTRCPDDESGEESGACHGSAMRPPFSVLLLALALVSACGRPEADRAACSLVDTASSNPQEGVRQAAAWSNDQVVAVKDRPIRENVAKVVDLARAAEGGNTLASSEVFGALSSLADVC
jgi:hypothetical protein